MVEQSARTTEQPLPLPRSDLLHLLERMLLIRRFEEKTMEMLALNRIRGYCHWNIGEEASVVGSVAAMGQGDRLVTSYRDHGFAIARGTPAGAVMAELFGKEGGCAGGRGGSMHMVDVPRGFFGGYGIVGGHLPLATGLALAADYLGEDRAVVCAFGDGATNIGAFHESLNLSKLWNLPVVWLLTNNQYGMGTSVRRASAESELYKRACAYNMHAEQVDGMDVLSVYEATHRLLLRARKQHEPALLETLTYRYPGHSYADPGRSYRTKEEIDRWKQRDPIRLFQHYLEEYTSLEQSEFDAIEKHVDQIIEEAVSFAEESPFPSPDSLFQHLYAEESKS
ncbi:MAG: pyruvate dehydrogenase (acetyl-transferring) E1 component subunit alpha [Chloroflexi bacterium]|nr:pyruvate dehydrogenase (acetyl-transferring) E1 component subunit alpha [Chloroflexota bacterium]